MAKRIFSREFKFEAVRSVKETTSPPGLGTVGKTLTSGKRCCRRQPLQANLDSAVLAVTVIIFIGAHDRFFDLPDELPLAVAVAQLDANVRFLARAVVGISEYRGVVLHGVHGVVDVPRKLFPQGFEKLLEVAPLPRVHVFLALFWHVGAETSCGAGPPQNLRGAKPKKSDVI